MNFTMEPVVHISFRKNGSYFVFLMLTMVNVKGEYFSSKLFLFYFSSYDGAVFHNQADSKHGHYYTSLAKIDGAPLAVGGSSSNTNKAETLDVSTNTWTEVAYYPYYD